MEIQSIILKPTLKYALLTNFKHLFYLICLLIVSELIKIPAIKLLCLVPLFVAVYNIAYLRLTKYEITAKQIKYSRGILSYKSDFLEMYRIKDYEINQTFIMRIFKIMHFSIRTSDSTHPMLVITGIPYSNIADLVREFVEKARKLNRVYEIDNLN